MISPSLGILFGGRYRLVRRLGGGGMGEVFLARAAGPAGFEKLFALKVAHNHMLENPEARESFLEEARLSALLTHANIAQIFDLGVSDGAYYIAMEYVPGRDLRALAHEVRRRDETLPVPIVCHIASRLCEGLDFAHRATDLNGKPLQLVHRDISPSNCLISMHGEVKLIDFGIAKAATGAVRTQNGVLKGKASYMSPEMIRGQRYDRRSDLFSVGVMLYELFTGVRPFEGTSEVDTLMKIVECKPEPLRKHNSAVPEVLERAVLKLMARKAEDRYQWASELGSVLDQYLVSTGTSVGAKDVVRLMTNVFGAQALVDDLGGYTPSPRVPLMPPAEPGVEPPPHPTLTATPAPMLSGTATRVSDEPGRLARELILPPIRTAPIARESQPPRRSRARVLALVLLLVALGGAGSFAVVRFQLLHGLTNVTGALQTPAVKRVTPSAQAQAPALVPQPGPTPTPSQAPALVPPPAPVAVVETNPEPTPEVAPSSKSGLAAAPASAPRQRTEPAVAAQPRKQAVIPASVREVAPEATEQPGAAYLTVQSNQRAKILVDGVEVGETPKALLPVTPGTHTVRVDCIYAWGRHEGRARSVTIPHEGEALIRHTCEEQAPAQKVGVPRE